jgi:iron complex outermembrane receptor protein
MYRVLLLLCANLLVVPSPIHAQEQTGAIEGRVIEATTGEPIPGANVALEGTERGAATNTDGRFRLHNIRAQGYTLVVSFVGYTPIYRQITVASGKTTVVDIELSLSDIELQEVEVTGRRAKTYDARYSFTATKVATAPINVPQAISIVTKEVLEDQQAYTLNDAVRNMSGVNTFSGYNDLVARGFRNQNVQLVNGLRMQFGTWNSPILPHVERVEYIKGPASALYGSTAPGGTVNLVTKKPLPESRQTLSASAASFGSYRATVDVTGPVDSERRLLYRFNGAYDRSNSFRNRQGYTTYLFAPSVSVLPTDRTRINADLVFSRRQGTLDRGQPLTQGGNLDSTPIGLSLTQPGDFQNISNLYLTLSLRHAFTDWLTFNTSYLKYSYREDLAEHRTANQYAPGDSTLMALVYTERDADRVVDNVTAYLHAQRQTGPVKHALLIGFDYYQQDDNRSQRLAVPNLEERIFDLDEPMYSKERDPSQYITVLQEERRKDPNRSSAYGFYAQEQLTMGRLQVLLSGRYELYRTRLLATDQSGNPMKEEALENVIQTAVLPRLGLVFDMTEKVNAYATFTQGFEPQDATIQQQPEVFGGPFDPQTSDLVEAGTKGRFFKDRLLAMVAAYQIRKRNVLVPAGAAGQPELREQRGEVRSRGVEMEVSGNLLAGLRLTANYAFNRAKITESNDPNEEGRRNENAPAHQGGFWGKYTLQRGPLKGISFGIGTHVVGKRTTFEENLQLPGYAVFDASLSYRISDVEITTYVDNFLDTTYWLGGYDYGRVFPGEPRNLRFKVSYAFD